MNHPRKTTTYFEIVLATQAFGVVKYLIIY